MLLAKAREEIVKHCQKMAATGLTPGTSGNISAFDASHALMAISPSGMDYKDLTPEDIVIMDLEGNTVEGKRTPSSEYQMHRIFYAERKDVGAVVHTHSPFATTLACLGWELPAIHYILAFAGERVPCAPYLTYGTKQLAEAAYQAAGDYNAVLLGNHGVLALGENIHRAFITAESVEYAAELYWRSLALGRPNTLRPEEMERVASKFSGYGQQE